MVWKKWLLSLSGAVLMGLASGILIYKRSPNVHEWPIFLAPITTAFVALMTFLDYMFDDEIDKEQRRKDIHFACVAGIIISGGFCWWLTFFHGWFLHLLYMSILFLLFFGWDLWMLSMVKHDEHRKQLANGNRHVNRPTLIAVALTTLFLFNVKLDSLQFVADKLGYDSAQDAFAAGLVSFHLVVSACGYLATSLGGIKNDSNWFLRLLHLVLYKIPSGPQ